MKHLDNVSFERIGNGFILNWFYKHEKQTEYYPTVGTLAGRINDMFTAENEGIEFRPLDNPVTGKEF